MKVGIGIDTGGTCTDAVAYDFSTNTVLAKGKALTTKEDLSIGIGAAIDALPQRLLAQAKTVSLSTTLATNACVEDKGGRARLLLVGAAQKVLDWVDAKARYGLDGDSVRCVETRGKDGSILEPDWEKLICDNYDWLRDANALSVAEANSFENGAAFEKKAKALLEERYDVPVVLASELVSELNVLERGATALLNARLLPVIKAFMIAVQSALTSRGLKAPVMMVRSDGSLMTDRLARLRPVETILSGPAASVLGGRELTDSPDCVIVDMGGTTTDISIVKDGVPVMAPDGIKINGWRTQVKGVFMDTFALGGDSAIRINNGRLELMARRVQPLCVAASRWPSIRDSLARLLKDERPHTHALHEFLFLVHSPDDISRYNARELALCNALEAGPLMLANAAEAAGSDIYSFTCERLEAEGIVMRCGLTPTDIMHIKGDYTAFDSEASELAARYFLQCLPQYDDNRDDLNAFADVIYEAVRKKLYENIVRVLLTEKHPHLLSDGLDSQLRFLISRGWQDRKASGTSVFSISMTTPAALVGIGAPTHLFLPEVADALGTRCIIPEHAEAANAVGAAIADISASAHVQISPIHTSVGLSGFTVLAPDGPLIFSTLEEASNAAQRAAVEAAEAEARRRGAPGKLAVQANVTTKTAFSSGGIEILLGATAFAIATNRTGNKRI